MLGTGGLVRAYSDSAKLAIENAGIITKDLGLEVNFIVSYSDLQKIEYYLTQNNVKIIDTKFQENVELICEITKMEYEKILLNKENFNFKILKTNILKNKYIEIALF